MDRFCGVHAGSEVVILFLVSPVYPLTRGGQAPSRRATETTYSCTQWAYLTETCFFSPFLSLSFVGVVFRLTLVERWLQHLQPSDSVGFTLGSERYGPGNVLFFGQPEGALLVTACVHACRKETNRRSPWIAVQGYLVGNQGTVSSERSRGSGAVKSRCGRQPYCTEKAKQSEKHCWD